MLKQLVTEEQASSALGISVDELRTMRDAGAGPDHFELSVRVVRYDLEDVTAWAEQPNPKGQ